MAFNLPHWTIGDPLPPTGNTRLDAALRERMVALQDTFETMAAHLPDQLVGGVYPPWHEVGAAGEPAFQNNWQNVGGAFASPLRFFRDALGFVYISGNVERTAGAGATIFTLPTGYRPAYRQEFSIPPRGGTEWINVYTDGTVQADFGAVNGTDYTVDLPPFRVI